MRSLDSWFTRVPCMVAAAGLTLCVCAGDSSATPAFARKYRTSCGTCHTSFPKLNAFGEAFRIGGYQIPGGDEAFIKEEPVSLGSEAWKRVFPEGVWPSRIPETVPLAVRATGAFVADLRGLGEPDSETKDGMYRFLFPAAFNLYAAGNLAEDMSLWFSAHVFQGSDWGSLGKLHVTFVSIGDAWVPRQLFNLRVGQFVPAALAFDHHRNLTFATPLVATANTVDGAPFGIGHVHSSGGAAGASAHNHGGTGTTYSGAFALGNAQIGTELYGLIGPRLEYTLGIVDGNGAAVIANSNKGYYGRLRAKFGGIAFDGTSADAGKGGGAGAPRLREQGAWVDNSVIVGAVGYWGKHGMQSTSTESHALADSMGKLIVMNNGEVAALEETVTTTYSNELFRAGGDVTLNLGDFELLCMAVYGRDLNPHGVGLKISSVVGMAQLDWVTPWPFLISSVRYETARFYGDGDHIPENAQQMVLGLTALVRANIRVQLEGHVDLVRKVAREERDYAAIILDASF